MATAGVGRLVTKNTCSICLEPFKGRFPKLLPCFHTFCLPCLNQMVTRTVSQIGQFGDGRQTETIITCPTCRKDCVVPLGGVAELQKNFYIEQEEDDQGQGHLQPIICDLCDQGQVASHRCTRCQLNLCFHCHRGHRNCHIAVRSNNERGDDAPTDENLQQLVDKGRDQMKVIERMVNKLSADESELNQQRRKLEDNCTALLRKIKSHSDAEEDGIKKNKADLQNKLDTLSQLLSNAEPSSLSAPSLKSALLPDADVSMMRDKTELDSRQTDFFQPLSASLNLGSAVQAHSDAGFGDGLLFGDGNQQPESSSQLQQAARVNELAQKVDMLMRQAHEQKTKSENKELIAEIRAMHDKNTILLQEVAALQAENGKLQTDFSSFQAQSGKMQKDVSVLQSENGKLQTDFSSFQTQSGKLQKDVSVLQSENGKLQKDFSEMKTQSEKMQKNISNVKSENGNLRKNGASLQSGFQDLSMKFAHSASRVAFYAFLGADMETIGHEFLINDQVSLNIGDGYNAQSGIFIVPVPGLYMFSASVTPSCTDKIAAAELKFYVHRNDNIFTLCSCTSSEIGKASCGQGVFQFDKGDKVYLQTPVEDCGFSSDGASTFFCGALIQPD